MIENLPGNPAGLFENAAAVFRVGVVAKVGPFVHEPLAVNVHDEPEGVGMFLEVLADFSVTKRRRAQIPLHGMGRAPMAMRLGADVEAHLDGVTRVVGGAANFGELPVRPQISTAHFGVRLKSARAKNNCASVDFVGPLRPANADAGDGAHPVRQKVGGLRRVADFNFVPLGLLDQEVHQAHAAAHGLEDKSAPEAKLAADVEGLPTAREDEAHVFFTKPFHCLK